MEFFSCLKNTPSLWTMLVFCLSFVPSANAENTHEIETFEGIDYAEFDGRKIQLDLYQPKAEGTYPGIILVHGGGWVRGSRKGFTRMAIDLASRGYVVANIDYRLAKEATFPASVEDAKAAVRWLRANAGNYGVNPEKIGGIGASAGGHLIAMAALTGHSNQFNGKGNNPNTSAELQAFIVMGSGMDQVARAQTSPKKYMKNPIAYFGGEYSDKPEVYALGSPINHISKQSPPVLMLDGGLDYPGQRYIGFVQRLMQNSIPHEFQIIKGAKHAEWKDAPFLPLYIDAFDRFFETYLR